MNDEFDTIRDTLKEVLNVLELAQSSHGNMLMSNPPQDPWIVHNVDDSINRAMWKVRNALRVLEENDLTGEERAKNKALKDEIDVLTHKLILCEHDRDQAAEAIQGLTEGKDFGEIVGKHIIENQAKIIDSQSNVIEILKEENNKISTMCHNEDNTNE